MSITTLARDTVHRDLLRDCLAEGLSEGDALLAMVLLHTHAIDLHPGAVAGGNGTPSALPALTQRDAAEVIAALWADLRPSHDAEATTAYWYRQYNIQTPYEVFDDVPDSLKPRLIELRDRLARDPRVAAVVAED